MNEKGEGQRLNEIQSLKKVSDQMEVVIKLSERDAGYLKDDAEAHIQDCCEGITELKMIMAEGHYDRHHAAMMTVYRIGIEYWKRILNAINERKGVYFR